MPFTVTATANRGRKPAYSLRLIVPRPILQELVPEIFNGKQPFFALNLAKEQDGEVIPYYKDHGFDFGLELFTGTDKERRKLPRDFKPKPLTKYGKSSFGFSIAAKHNKTALQLLGLEPGVKLACDVVTLKEPTLGYSDRAILYKISLLEIKSF